MDVPSLLTLVYCILWRQLVFESQRFIYNKILQMHLFLSLTKWLRSYCPTQFLILPEDSFIFVNFFPYVLLKNILILVDNIYVNKGCSTHGFYGNQCNIPCSSNCKEKACHIENGTCFTCEPGWTGPFCTESNNPWYFVCTVMQV